MGLKAGALLWNRKTLRFVDAGPNPQPLGTFPLDAFIDTELAQPNTSFPDYSPNEPRIDAHTTLGLVDIGSRIQVIPMSPIPNWAFIAHGEPFLDVTDPANPRIKVRFIAAQNTVITVLFWDPHAIVGPGDADRYQKLP